MSATDANSGKMMLGFVVRRCAVALGHTPTAAELATWANDQRDGERRYCIFGRAITVQEARVILRHPGREVSVRDMAGQVPLTLAFSREG